MSPTQKKFIEFPLLLLIIWIVQALEISLLRLPFQHGAIQVIPIIIVYLALTRSWGRLGILALVFSLIGSFTIGYSAGVYVSVYVWTALFTKVFVSEFALEGRRPFTLLVVGAHFFSKILTWGILSYYDQAMPMGLTIRAALVSVLATAVVAFYLFPILVAWDEYFEHPIHESRDLNPDILR